MKERFLRISFSFCSLLLASAIIASAQTSNIPVISVIASDPNASEAGPDPGAFTIRREGPTNTGFRVFFTLRGTASNGVDYETISENVEMPSGVVRVVIPVKPIDDTIPEPIETVNLRLVPSPLAGAIDQYRIGSPTNAVVSISDNDHVETNRTVVNITATDPEGSEIPEVPPGMEMPQLVDPAIFTVTRSGNTNIDVTVYYSIGGTASNGVDYDEIPKQITIPAGARSADIWINPIDDFLVEGPETVVIEIQPPVCVAIDPPPPECYLIGFSGRATAVIRDNEPATNKPPLVSIMMPTNGSVFVVPANIHIAAQASDSDGYVSTVEFFAGTNSLGVTTNNPLAMNPVNPFQITWSNVPPGDYVLTALATDDGGASSRSWPVKVAVVREPAQQTVVNIVAVDSEAAEQSPLVDAMPNTARLRVTRSGPTNVALTVLLRISGTAENGIDYAKLPDTITIPAGALSADIIIEAIDDDLAEGTESVEIGVVAPVCVAIYPPPPDCYLVGSSGRAVAFILDNDGPIENLRPSVTITRLPNGAVFRSPADIHIEAVATDRDGYCSFMEFFANSNKIGEVTLNFFVAPPPGQPITFDFDWKGVRPGNYLLTARATDDKGATGTSEPIRISVTESNLPPPTNLPIVSIVASDPYASEGLIIWTTTSVGGMEPVGTSLWSSNDWAWRTNLVPVTNTATFTIRREGPTNSSLRVYYEIGGTASNGVDYEALRGVAEIPAGQRATRVIIVPIDDTIPEGIESVILGLKLPPLPLADGDNPYTLGYSRRAAAIIADNDLPRPPMTCLGDGLFHICRPGTNGFCYRIDATTNLTDWTAICTNRVLEGAIQYVDPDAPSVPARFYRILPADCPPE